jgi:hypothetical protein
MLHNLFTEKRFMIQTIGLMKSLSKVDFFPVNIFFGACHMS